MILKPTQRGDNRSPYVLYPSLLSPGGQDPTDGDNGSGGTSTQFR